MKGRRKLVLRIVAVSILVGAVWLILQPGSGPFDRTAVGQLRPMVSSELFRDIPVTQIRVRVVTSDINFAGTDDEIFLGLGGREFNLDTSGDDFERGADETFILGEGSNNEAASGNDPRQRVLISLGDVNDYPIYIRKQETTELRSEWKIDYVEVAVNEGEGGSAALMLSKSVRGLVFSSNCGFVLYLKP